MKRLDDLSFSLRFFSVPLLVVACWACAQTNRQMPPPSGDWRSSMQDMGLTLVEIYPYLVSAREFDAPENRALIQKNLQKMAKLAHGVNMERGKTQLGKKMDNDPYVAVIANVLDREINLAVEGLKAGKRDFSRAVLKNATGMCIRCHSRGQWGPEFVDWEKETAFKRLEPMEKGQLLSAVRHYDQALKQYELVLSKAELARNEADVWIKAGNAALNVAVRAQQDPEAAEKIVNIILANESLPSYQRRNAESWKRAIVEWKSGQHSGKSGSDLVKAQKILKDAHRNEDYWGDRSSYIHYLRASALLHDFLRTEASTEDQARALYLLGQSYEVIAEMGDGEANEFYYKACIKRSPHTKVAVGCYRRLEQNLYLDFSGNGDIQFPNLAMEELRAFKTLAAPVEPASSFEGGGMFDRQ